MKHLDPRHTQSASRPPPTTAGFSSAPRKWIAKGALAAAFVVAGAVGVNLLAGTAASQAAEPGATSGTSQSGTDTNGSHVKQQRGVAGEITAINGSTITVSSMDRKGKQQTTDSTPETSTFTVSTASSTTFSKIVDGTVGDLAKGDIISIAGTTSNGTVTAKGIRQVDQLPDPEQGQGMRHAPHQGPGRSGQHTLGTITAVNGSTVTVKTVSGGSVTATTTSDTKVSVIEKASISDLAMGDTIRVKGMVSGTKVAATTVTAGLLGSPGMHAPDRAPAPDGITPSTSQPS